MATKTLKPIFDMNGKSLLEKDKIPFTAIDEDNITYNFELEVCPRGCNTAEYYFGGQWVKFRSDKNMVEGSILLVHWEPEHRMLRLLTTPNPNQAVVPVSVPLFDFTVVKKRRTRTLTLTNVKLKPSPFDLPSFMESRLGLLGMSEKAFMHKLYKGGNRTIQITSNSINPRLLPHVLGTTAALDMDLFIPTPPRWKPFEHLITQPTFNIQLAGDMLKSLLDLFTFNVSNVPCFRIGSIWSHARSNAEGMLDNMPNIHLQLVVSYPTVKIYWHFSVVGSCAKVLIELLEEADDVSVQVSRLNKRQDHSSLKWQSMKRRKSG